MGSWKNNFPFSAPIHPAQRRCENTEYAKYSLVFAPYWACCWTLKNCEFIFTRTLCSSSYHSIETKGISRGKGEGQANYSIWSHNKKETKQFFPLNVCVRNGNWSFRFGYFNTTGMPVAYSFLIWTPKEFPSLFLYLVSFSNKAAIFWDRFRRPWRRGLHFTL